MVVLSNGESNKLRDNANNDGVASCFGFRRGIHRMPLESPNIHSDTHTYTLLLGEEEMVLVDPDAATEKEN